MGRLRAPYGRGVVTASGESAKRYKAAGWVEVKDETDEKPKVEPRKRTAKGADKK